MSILSEFLHQVAPKDDWGTAFVTAGLGTLVGGWVAGRALTKRAIVAELNALSAVLTLSLAARNGHVGLKSQHVRGMKNRLDKLRQDHQAYLSRPRGSPLKFPFRADFRTLPPLVTPTAELRRIFFAKTSVRGRGLVPLADLATSEAGLLNAIDEHRSVCEEMRDRRSQSKSNDAELVALYLGLRMADGHVDEWFPALVDAIYAQTDDCIFFAGKLGEDLLSYANSRRRRYMWRHFLFLPEMQGADWARSSEASLLPPDSQYERWLSAFRKVGFWKRLRLILTP